MFYSSPHMNHQCDPNSNTSRNFSKIAQTTYLYISIIQLSYPCPITVNPLSLMQNVLVLLLMVFPNYFLTIDEVFYKFSCCIMDGIAFSKDLVLKLQASITTIKVAMLQNAFYIIFLLLINHN